jgi:hypothetical protein
MSYQEWRELPDPSPEQMVAAQIRSLANVGLRAKDIAERLGLDPIAVLKVLAASL